MRRLNNLCLRFRSLPLDNSAFVHHDIEPDIDRFLGGSEVGLDVPSVGVLASSIPCAILVAALNRRGLLSSFIMFGEHKGVFTAVLSNALYQPPELNPVFFRKTNELNLTVCGKTWKLSHLFCVSRVLVGVRGGTFGALNAGVAKAPAVWECG
jgi:hypothetical protein